MQSKLREYTSVFYCHCRENNVLPPTTEVQKREDQHFLTKNIEEAEKMDQAGEINIRVKLVF